MFHCFAHDGTFIHNQIESASQWQRQNPLTLKVRKHKEIAFIFKCVFGERQLCNWQWIWMTEYTTRTNKCLSTDKTVHCFVVNFRSITLILIRRALILVCAHNSFREHKLQSIWLRFVLFILYDVFGRRAVGVDRGRVREGIINLIWCVDTHSVCEHYDERPDEIHRNRRTENKQFQIVNNDSHRLTDGFSGAAHFVTLSSRNLCTQIRCCNQ